jgi:PKD repeat protein
VSPDVSHVVIHYSIDGGENWLNIQSTPYPAIVGQYDWLVPNTLSDQVLVRVTKHSENDIYVISDGEFSIIEAIVPPTADFTADVTEGLEPLTVQFTDESQPASYISSWLWDFGDDEGTSTERHPEYTYQAPGSYTVSLTVTTIMDESDTLTREDYITVIEREPEITLLTNTEMSFGSANIAEFSSYQPVVYSNTGTANLVVSDINFIDVPEHFEMLHQMRNVMLEPGEIDTLYVRFAPQTVGTLVATLFITSNAVNQPLISIRLQGTGLYVPPKAPENVDITMDGYDAVITWDPVTENEHGEPIDPDFYAVYYNGSSDIEGQYYFHGLSYNTDYTHDHVSMFADHMFYMVKAIKIYAPPTRSREYAEQVERYFRENLKEGMTEEGVSEVIQNVYLEF